MIFYFLFLNFFLNKLNLISLHIPQRATKVNAWHNVLFHCSFASLAIIQSNNDWAENNCMFGSTYQTAVIDLQSGNTYNNTLLNNTAISEESGQR